ncbi:glycosyltransferase family A protein [Paenibacillus sp. XY044]|uniref:glycosyltransferase family 2 protein n=1 Tax=Paenibacillus sp. XY044 TaxID=2026089 RepID=UPI0015C5FC01|nr:glycosyltransferase family A protein [Paenibacillus sp. XY044]
MLVFILPSYHLRHAQLTASSVRQELPDSNMIVLEQGSFGSRMNRELASYQEPYFLTLQAGEQVLPGMDTFLRKELSGLTGESAGCIFSAISHTEGQHGRFQLPRGPLIWRTDAVMAAPSSGFAETALLPFESYILVEKQYQLTGTFMWTSTSNPPLVPAVSPSFPWQKRDEEWELLRPLLASPIQVEPRTGAAPEAPLVTVLLCTYNDADYIPWAVRSVMAQSLRDWELLIIDDGSTDHTARILESLYPDRRIRTFRLERNSGKAHALNTGLSLANGSWLLELDADDWLSPNCLEQLCSKASLHNQAGVIYADHVQWEERKNKQLIYQGVRTSIHPFSPARVIEAGIPIAPRMFNTAKLKSFSGWNTASPSGGRLYEDIEILARMSGSDDFHYVDRALYHRRIRIHSMTHRHADHYAEWLKWMDAQDNGAAPKS